MDKVAAIRKMLNKFQESGYWDREPPYLVAEIKRLLDKHTLPEQDKPLLCEWCGVENKPRVRHNAALHDKARAKEQGMRAGINKLLEEDVEKSTDILLDKAKEDRMPRYDRTTLKPEFRTKEECKHEFSYYCDENRKRGFCNRTTKECVCTNGWHNEFCPKFQPKANPLPEKLNIIYFGDGSPVAVATLNEIIGKQNEILEYLAKERS